MAVTTDGKHYLVETKGREDVDVANKDRAATIWCENATRLTATSWEYTKVPQKEFEQLQPDEFADLAAFVSKWTIIHGNGNIVGNNNITISVAGLAGDSTTDAPPPVRKNKKNRKRGR